MGGEDSERALANRVDARCGYNNLNSPFARRIVSEMDALLNEHNEMLKLFKSHMPKLLSDNHAIFINPEKQQLESTYVDSLHLLLATLPESWLATVQLSDKS
ncbi:uncharacterized protein CEXT_700631 [Caerostris extrusa]|uniref:Uncharacterized protein n=1 Tax=Caerostris extrusa TaxID=172846 RepID=A0AAV4UE50_CAEEX|nr:uncharacterized protein CEXT_700631 [Caerostris extrusa]